jgi:SAM-dependent methyltransferase
VPGEAAPVPARETLDAKGLDVSREVMPGDQMYAYDPVVYFDAGARALRHVEIALLAAGREGADHILDFACGAGRVTRYLHAAFPDASLTACDVYPEGPDFCARHFGARPLRSNHDLSQLEIGGPYDLIWVGSLFTHVGDDDWDRLLTMFAGALDEHGVLVFTTYGRAVADLLRSGETTLNLQPDHVAQIVSDYDRHGFGFFADFEPEHGHGDSLAASAWVTARLEQFPSLRLLLYSEDAWLRQDVIAVRSL